MKKLIFSSTMFALALAASTLATSAIAAQTAYPSCQLSAPPCVFPFENDTWLLTHGGRGTPMTAVHMTPGFGAFCPQHAITLEPAKPTAGGRKYAMTPDEKFRGDVRFHVMCDRTVHLDGPQAPGAAMSAPPPSQETYRQSVTPPQAVPQRLGPIDASDEERL